jgi:hypothetical protein
MADLIRTAKSASDWGRNELRAYGINMRTVDSQHFFGRIPSEVAAEAQEFLATTNWKDAQGKDTLIALRLLGAATSLKEAHESSVDDFSTALFNIIGYVSRTRMARSRMPMALHICGEARSAQADICLLNEEEIVLLVQEDKRFKSEADPEPQLVAEAVAAFQRNSAARERRQDQQPLEEAVIPGVVMVGACPTFYKVRVTSELADAVMGGRYPKHQTEVLVCPLEKDGSPLEPGLTMLDPSCREVSLKYFEAFKQFIGD